MTALSDTQLGTLRRLKPSDAEVDLEPFGMIVSTWARLSDQEPLGIAQSGHFVAAIAAACQDLPIESPFHKSARFAGLHERLAGAMKELAGWGLDPDALDALASECSPHLGTKLRSLASIQRKAEEMLADLGRELNYHHIRQCVEGEPYSDLTFPRCLLVADEGLCPQHVEWMNWAARIGTDLTVVIPFHSAIPAMFPAARHLEDHLDATVFEVGYTSPFLAALFTENTEPSPEITVSAFYAADPLAEVEWALRGCVQAAQELDYRELGIYARNLEDYAPLVEAAAMRLNVPIQLNRRAPLETNSCIRTLQAILEFVSAPDVRRLNRIARSSYIGLTHEQRKEIEDAIATALQQADEQWNFLSEWAAAKSEAWPWLVHILAWRKDAVEGLSSTAVWISRLQDLMNGMTWEPAEGHLLDRDIRARNALERALMQQASIENLSDRQVFTLPQFISFVKRVVKDADSSLPSASSGVQVAGSAESFHTTQKLFVLGMLEGSFPRRRSEDPILTDENRQEINHLRPLLFPLPDSFDRARAERDEFLTVCAIPNDSLVFSFPETTDDRDNIRAFYLEEVKRVLDGRLDWPRRPRQELAPPLEACVATSDKEIRVALEGPKEPPIELRPLALETRESLAPLPDEPLAPRELRTAIECPFRHFAAELLNISPDRQRRRWHNLRKLPQVAQLSAQPDEMAARRALSTALEVELDRIRIDLGEWEYNLLARGGRRLIDEWIEREFRAREIWPKDADSEHLNVQFGQDDLRGEIPRVGRIKGSVAGTARMGPYKVIQLVESSPPSADKNSPIRLKDRDALYYGLHMLAGFDRDSAMAIEVESMKGGRRLLVLPGLPEPPLVGDVESGLEVIDLGSEADPAIVRKVFFDKVKELLEKASRSIREVDVRATKGEHCQWCDYGELCRSSSEFGEDESPFEDVNGD